MMSGWPDAELGRPIRTVLFGGIYLEPAALRFAARLDAHPEIDFLGAFCQGEGDSLRIRTRDLLRRWGVLGIPLLLREAQRSLRERGADPREATVHSRIRYVPDLHATAVVARIRELEPDLGLIYGAPILRPELFTIPAFGTLGIHHGTLPGYRGRKTTFWAMYNGERTAGVVIQRVNAGIDTGDVVAQGDVVIGRKPLRRVWADLQNLGIDLYLDAVLAVKRGHARLQPQSRPEGAPAKLYRQPTLADVIRFGWRRLRYRSRDDGAGE
jgi:folate-dependent phosphoribosylglycinamide formyltransferase PurN